MNAVGIIAEFNPFHPGHAHLIQRVRKITDSDCVVAVMNGDFMQRGEPAIFDKYRRVQAALEGGVDLVMELPVRFGLSSAGDFALGGVMALSSLGFVTHLAFGSECGDISPLLETAAILAEEPGEFRSVLSHNLRKGMPYPAARARAITHVSDVSATFLHQPNNILGTEYCLALKKLSSPLVPVTIPRVGMRYHDTAPDVDGKAGFPSAATLRRQIRTTGSPHLELNDFSSAMGYALLAEKDLEQYKDMAPALASRIRRLLSKYRKAGELAEQCQTRAFTAGRVRRALMQCLLRIEPVPPAMPYLRLLGLKTKAGTLLLQVPDSCHILSRLAADMDVLDADALALLRQDLFAADLYRQTWCRKYDAILPNEYQRSPIVLDN